MKLLLLLTSAVFLFFSCTVTEENNLAQEIITPKPTAKNAELSGTPLKILKQGHRVYINNCAQCHEHRLPSSATLSDYHLKICNMSNLAQLSQKEEYALHSYLDQFTDR